MKCRHKHLAEVQRLYMPPSRMISEVERCSDELFMSILYGITNIELRCEDCGDIIIRTTPGKV